MKIKIEVKDENQKSIIKSAAIFTLKNAKISIETNEEIEEDFMISDDGWMETEDYEELISLIDSALQTQESEYE